MLKKHLILLLLILGAFFYGCEKDPVFDHDYLLSYNLVRSHTADKAESDIRIFETLYPDIGAIADNIETGIKVYRISYKTTFQGEDIIASGLVSFPDADGIFPILSFQNGTNTCHSNAPSENPGNLLYSLLYSNSGNGFIISIPDYLGFGESNQLLHPYYHTESNNRVIRDMLMAIVELSDYFEGKSTDKSLYLMGYSQGGWATMSVLKDLETNPLEGFNLISASCGAGGYDLIDFTEYLLNLETFPNPFYLPYFIESRRRIALINENLDVFFKEPYSTMIPGLFNGMLCNANMNDQFSTNISELLTDNLINNFDEGSEFISLRHELLQCKVDPWQLSTPMLIGHSRGDLSVPFSQSVDMYENLLNAGSPAEKLEFFQMEDLLHNDAIIPWGIKTLKWFLDL